MVVADSPDILGHRMISARVVRLRIVWDGFGFVILAMRYLGLVFTTGDQIGSSTRGFGVSCPLSLGLGIHSVEETAEYLGR